MRQYASIAVIDLTYIKQMCGYWIVLEFIFDDSHIFSVCTTKVATCWVLN